MIDSDCAASVGGGVDSDLDASVCVSGAGDEPVCETGVYSGDGGGEASGGGCYLVCVVSYE